MIIEELKNRTEGNSPENVLAERLHRFACDAAEKAKDHTKRILIQLPEFDLHDEVHLSAVLDNLERIIGKDLIAKLSVYELFFLFTSAYLHDTGMALPDWELKIIEAVESENTDSWKSAFNVKTPLTLLIARRQIVNHSVEIYENFNKVEKWFFAPDTEDTLIEHLAQTAVQYQEFRNGFTKKLKSLSGDKKKQYVRALRIEFIRQTHHIRSQLFIKNLSHRMSDEIQPWGEAIARDLAIICRSHGESISFVEELNTNAQYLGSETANLQFVASLLRVADIVHYSFDRAPSVLASAMQFISDESFAHWAVKQQGVNYNVTESGDMGQKTIRFRAYCKKPRYYYELHTYLDWVDCELSNYARISRKWELSIGKDRSERWRIPLSDEVDRSGIEYDSDSFTPVPNLSFRLEQKRILELLMGVQLYKDKYACLRELYQNSLDACRCMISLSDGKESGRVEFWIESEGDGKHDYLCCFDNGVGMTKDIVLNHLLNIGNSFYTSPTFERLRAAHDDGFTPTSQFGIGILSCFMLGDRLDIVTRPMQEFSEETTAIRFTVDGVHENFYYSAPDPVDLEKIGKHGTIVRIRLLDQKLIQNTNDGKIWFRYFASRMSYDFQDKNKHLFKNWDNHLHKIITKFISLPQQDINISVLLADDSVEKVCRWDYPFRRQEVDIEESDIQLLKEHKKKNPSAGLYFEEKTQYQMQQYPCRVEFNGAEFSWLLKLPISDNEAQEDNVLSDVMTFGAFGLSIDGVSVDQPAQGSDKQNLAWLTRVGHLNFRGETRPVLSVDRTSITSWPDTITSIVNKILSGVIRETIDVVHKHVVSKGLIDNDSLIFATWDHLLELLSPFTSEILSTLATDKVYSEAYLRDIENLTQGAAKSFREFLDLEEILLPHINFQELSLAAQLLFLGKCGNTDQIAVDERGLCLSGRGFTSIASDKRDTERAFSSFLLRCDEWTGPFDEYDLVSQYWPIVPAKTFDQVIQFGENKTLDSKNRYSIIQRFSNGITALGEQDPCLIHPQFGLYQHNESFSLNRNNKKQCMVGNFDKKEGEHWLYEINGHYVKEGTARYVLFVYISPRKLTDEEENRLKEYEIKSPDYVEGVRKGWSILFLGQKDSRPIIRPGIVSRELMVNAIGKEVWEKLGDDEYLFLDGTPLRDTTKTGKKNK
jgi:hypothetical protein